MSKKVARACELQSLTGRARPRLALVPAGTNMLQFCTVFNDATEEHADDVVPITIIIHEDKSFDLVIKTTPAAMIAKKAAGVKKASGDQKEISGKITVDQLREITEYKMPGLNANDVEAAMCVVTGTAKNTGAEIEGSE